MHPQKHADARTGVGREDDEERTPNSGSRCSMTVVPVGSGSTTSRSRSQAIMFALPLSERGVQSRGPTLDGRSGRARADVSTDWPRGGVFVADGRSRAPDAHETRLLGPRGRRLPLEHVPLGVMRLEGAGHVVALVMPDSAQQVDGLPGAQHAGIRTRLGDDAVPATWR